MFQNEFGFFSFGVIVASPEKSNFKSLGLKKGADKHVQSDQCPLYLLPR